MNDSHQQIVCSMGVSGVFGRVLPEASYCICLEYDYGLIELGVS